MKKLIRNNGPSYHFSTDIPEHYNSTALRILYCTPQTLYAYWELAAEYRKPGITLQLRITTNDQVTGEIKVESSITLGENECSRYLDVPIPGLPYSIELGVMGDDNVFTGICSANQKAPPESAVFQHDDEADEYRLSAATVTEISVHYTILEEKAPIGHQYPETARRRTLPLPSSSRFLQDPPQP
jgi:hypothetical protein